MNRYLKTNPRPQKNDDAEGGTFNFPMINGAKMNPYADIEVRYATARNGSTSPSEFKLGSQVLSDSIDKTLEASERINRSTAEIERQPMDYVKRHDQMYD